MIILYDAGTGARLGSIAEDQFQFMVDQLEEESLSDQDYYINQATLSNFEQEGAPSELMTVLREALGTRMDMDVRWEQE